MTSVMSINISNGASEYFSLEILFYAAPPGPVSEHFWTVSEHFLTVSNDFRIVWDDSGTSFFLVSLPLLEPQMCFWGPETTGSVNTIPTFAFLQLCMWQLSQLNKSSATNPTV